MARGRRSRQRDAIDVSNPDNEVAAVSTITTPITLSPTDVIGTTDNRMFNPEGDLTSPSFFGGSYVDSDPGLNPGSIVPVSDLRSGSVQVGTSVPQFGFVDPRRVTECNRRKERREVMFALRKRKKGSGARRRRRTRYSDIRC